MNPNDKHDRPDSLDANLSKLICKDNLPPTLPENEKEAMLAHLVEAQSSLTSHETSSRRKILPFALGGLVAAVIVTLFVANDLFLEPASPDPIADTPEQPENPTTVPPETVVEKVEAPAPQPIVYESIEKTRRIELRDGSTVIAERGTRFTELRPRSLQLDEGSLYVLVRKSETPLEIITSEGRAEALGTRFVVTAKPQDTRVAVAQGTVRLVRNEDDQPLNLVRGEEGVLAPTELIRRPAPRLSHLVNWAREALRQGETPDAPLVRNGLLVVDPNGQESKLSLREYTLDVHIENGVARTTIDQTFFNHLQSNTEGTFYFPLPPRAAVSRLAMYVNGIRNEGGMVERHRGQQIYNDIKYANRDPALLEQLEGNLYKLRIFPLEPRQEKRIFLSFTQTVDELYRTLNYWFPMNHTHENSGKVKIQVRIKDGEQFETTSSTHDFKKRIENGDLVLTYEASNIKPDQDLLLSLIPKVKGTKLTETATLQREDGNYLHTRIRPELVGVGDAAPRQWFILNDTSASRSKDDLKAQAHIVERLLAEADDHDTVTIANLNIDAQRLTEELVPLRGDAAASAVERIRNAERLGGTNLAAGINAVRAWIAESGAANPHIVYLGDGLASDGAVTTNELTEFLDKNVPFLGIAVGKNADLSFLRSAADATGGGAFLMNPDEDLNWRVFDLLASLNTLRLTGISFEFPKVDSKINAYSDRTTLAAGEVLTIVASTTGDLPAKVLVRGMLNGEPWERTITLNADDKDAGFIPRFWAQRHLEELLKEGEKHREEIVRLSKKHYVATPFTSLIVLEDDKMYQDYKVEKGRKDHWAAYDAPDKIPVVREPVPWVARAWNQQPANSAPPKITIDPQTEEEIHNTIQPTPAKPPTIVAPWISFLQARTKRGMGKKNLYLADGFYDLGLYDRAREEYTKVLRFDIYNKDARRGLERISAVESDYYRAAYDVTRASLLKNVDVAWEIPASSFVTTWAGDINGLSSDILLGGQIFDLPKGNSTLIWNGLNFSGKSSQFNRQLLSSPPIDGRGGMPGANFSDSFPITPSTPSFRFRGRGFNANSRNPYVWYTTFPLVGHLTTLIPGLTTFPSDPASMVEMKFGREKRGHVSDEAAALIRAAEGKRKPVRIKGALTTPNGRLKSSSMTPLFLKEEIVSDGKSLFHIYRELGLAARRPVTPSNLALIRSTVPHWPPSLSELESRWMISLAAQEDDWFEIVLVDPDDQKRIHRLKISSKGRLLEVRQFKEEELLSTLTFRYENDTVVVESEDGDRESYEAVEVDVAEALFEADLKNLVTLDLPLRWPAFYERKLASLGKEELDQRKQLLRHFIIARLWAGNPAFLNDGTKKKPSLDAHTAWSQLIQLGDGTTPVFDHRTLAAAVNINSVMPKNSDFLTHFKTVTTLGSSYPQRAQVEAFIRDWPDSPYLVFLVDRCLDMRAWIPLLDIPAYRDVAITRIAAVAEAENWPERADLATRVADFLSADAKAGHPMIISPLVARFLGREQQANTNWRRVVASYRELTKSLDKLEPHHIAAILDLAIKEKDEVLQQHCLDQLLPDIKTRQTPLDFVTLADLFSSQGQHEKATELYKMALAVIKDPSPTLLRKAAAAIRETDEHQAISWLHQALRKLGAGNYRSNKQALASEYSQLLGRTLKVGDLESARQIALEGYDHLSEHHSLMVDMAGHFHREGNEVERWRWLSTIRDRHPKNAQASGAIGDCYMTQSLFPEAAAMYAEAHTYDSAHPQWLIKQAGALYRVGKFEDADKLFRKLTTTDWAHQLKRQIPSKIRQELTNSEATGKLSTDDPGEDWHTPGFDDSGWTERPLTFAANDDVWGKSFWTRQEFEIVRLPRRIDLTGRLHGVACEIYLNGKLIKKFKGAYTRSTGKESHFSLRLRSDFLKSLQPGRNVLAIRYQKTGNTPHARLALEQVFVSK